ncbi:uncharacterized protein CELE_Y47D7A.17 [Caenorhabditis elegans]|uniref:Uncharacterized protein n=1 Tax=Caenorhabditis elegans TaxID=6239 RepID=D6RYE1_CAEEL|nr:Uncharacterized protein CELE_Y47D7A.17 [Caenorhabditis elegans]CCD69386.1 Uncharacterized protein CELE_Y47D7A.17 [Caenorhabditis elegans]|eukprot:NP_001256039.1 Uncharacterized protein CELE_Y47D7A.17 [Caenorhabditis elegans]
MWSLGWLANSIGTLYAEHGCGLGGLKI